MIFTIVGFIAVTLLFAWVFLYFFSMGFFCLIGFDEFHIRWGIGCMLAAAGVGYLWWVLVGHLIHISIAT